jgi:hypothetical protein
MEQFTIEHFQQDFDNLLNRVENGESFLITSEYGNVVMTPYVGTNQSSVVDEFVKIHTEHEDGP